MDKSVTRKKKWSVYKKAFEPYFLEILKFLKNK